MSNITNQPKITHDRTVNEVRKAIEHRATWFYHLLLEARKHNLDWDEFARPAIRNTGTFHGLRMQDRVPHEAGLIMFEKAFAPGAARKVFEMKAIEQNEENFILDFHYCPLVAAWQKLGASPEDIIQMCDMAMDGDRAIADTYPKVDFELGETIAQGACCCRVKFSRHTD